MESNISQIELVKDIKVTSSGQYYSPGISSEPRYLIEFNDLLYFAAADGVTGRELWVSDGRAEGTQLVADINPNDGEDIFDISSNPGGFIEFSDRLYFTARDGVTGDELWVTDGTAEGTQLLADINPENNSIIGELTVAGDRLFFAADDGTNGRELWVTDGSSEGTQLVKDIDPGITDGYFYPFEPRVDASFPQELVAVGDLVYFSADDGETGTELWVSDGTEAGTQLVKDINPGFDDSEYIYARIGKSRRLETPRPLGSNPQALVEFKDKIYFSATDGINGGELWVSDGTEVGTQLVKDINPLTSQDGSARGSYPRNFIQLQDRLYFTANDGVTGDELWVTDGTSEGTKLVADINPNNIPNSTASSSYPRYFSEFDNKLFFAANDGEVGKELWITDGTTEGTKLVKDIDPVVSYFGEYSSANDSGIYEFTEFAGRLYFAARTENEGRELWVTDGTTEGTQLVEDLYPGFRENYDDTSPYDSYPYALTVVGNELFFAADNGEVGRELFKLTAEDLNSEPDPDTEDTEAFSFANVSEDGQVVSSSSSSSTNSGSVSSSASAVNVAGSVSMIGGDGGDRLSGNSGDDLLDGNLGDDTLTGGLGADTFVLRAGDGTDIITDFEVGTDSLGLSSGLQFEALTFSGNTISSASEVLATLNGVDTASLTADNFEVI